ncbi:MAG: rhodanese-like domain-containing protein [FCB group bacterium]|nr:rhodanese-like domain-containing protein [FCB group bacterium]
MKKPGIWKLFFNRTPATIEVINYDKPNYQEIRSTEAWELLQETDPFILDVRTPMEYAGGHLKDATLIPVQVLQSSLAQLDSVRNSDILVYCRTGNRSTVASKILLDNGFKRVYNLQGGIVDWKRKSYPIEK